MENKRNLPISEGVKQSLSLEERKEDLLFQSVKAFDELRRRTLVLSRYRDTDVLAQDIDDLLKEIKKAKYGRS